MTDNLPIWLLVAAYIFPAIVAAMRGHQNRNAIFILNLLLGWTLLGWVAALVWAATVVNKPESKKQPKPEDHRAARKQQLWNEYEARRKGGAS